MYIDKRIHKKRMMKRVLRDWFAISMVFVFLLSFVPMIPLPAAKTSGIKSVAANVKIYGATTKEAMIDHIILQYSAKVKLPKSLAQRKKLYTLQDYWYGGTRKITNVYTNNKAAVRKDGKSKSGCYVIIQFQKKKNPVFTKASYAKKQHAGNVSQYNQEENREYKRYNCESTLAFTQNKNIYSIKGKLIKKAGKIKIKSTDLKWTDRKKPPKLTKQMSYTISTPDSYRYLDKKNKGTIETVTYQSKDYYRQDGKIYQKKALVYLPKGYEKNGTKRYPILYYMHGTGQSEEYGYYMQVFFDNMISEELIEPMIVVFPTFYTNNDSKDANIGYHNEDVYDQEFRNELMIAVESRYRTFAQSTSREDLIASRDHRAFTGLSAGGFITWQTFLDNSEYVKYYIPLAGFLTNIFGENGYLIPHAKTTQMAIDRARELKKQGLDYRIIECCGTKDEQMTEFVQKQYEILTKEQDVFDIYHYQLLWTEGAAHEKKAFDDGLYNALPQCFPGKKFK